MPPMMYLLGVRYPASSGARGQKILARGGNASTARTPMIYVLEVRYAGQDMLLGETSKARPPMIYLNGHN